MQIRLKILILTLGLCSLYCSTEKDKTSKVWTRKTFYENGSLKSEMEILDSLPNGKSIDYYPSGKIQLTLHFTNGVKEGLLEYFYESGALKVKQNYSNDKRHGEGIGYYESGNIAWQGKFYNDHLVGEHITYFDDNRKKIKQIIDYTLYDKTSQINTNVVYDSTGNIIYKTPTFTVDEDSESLKIHVIDKEYKNIRFILGQFDKYYLLESMESLDTINSKDNLNITVPYQKGDTLRGYIDNYKQYDSDSGIYRIIWFSYPRQWN